MRGDFLMTGGLAVASFAGGWAWQRVRMAEQVTGREESAGAMTAEVRISGRKKGKDGVEDGQTGGVVAGKDGMWPEVFDPQVREALANPDVAEAVKAIMAREQEDHCADTRLIQLVENLPVERLEQLVKVLEAHHGNSWMRRHLLGAWAQRQPEAAMAWASAHPGGSGANQGFAFTGWVRRDPDKALAWLDGQPVSSSQRALQTSCISALSETDAPRAWELMRDRGWMTTNASALQSLLRNWSGRDPAAALQALRKMAASSAAPGSVQDASSPLLSQGIGAVLSGASGRNPAEVRALLAELTDKEWPEVSHSVARDFLLLHPQEISAMVFSSFPPGPREEALLASLRSQDPELLLREIAGLDSSPERKGELLVEVLKSSETLRDTHGGDLLKDPELAQGLLQAASRKFENGKADELTHLAVNLAAQNADLARGVWQLIPAGEQERTAPFFVMNLAEENPALAEEWFETRGEEPGSESWRGLLAGMSKRDPERAMARAMQAGDVRERTRGAAAVLMNWPDGTGAQPAAAVELERLASLLDLPALRTELESSFSLTTETHSRSWGRDTATLLRKLDQLSPPLPAPAP